MSSDEGGGSPFQLHQPTESEGEEETQSFTASVVFGGTEEDEGTEELGSPPVAFNGNLSAACGRDLKQEIKQRIDCLEVEVVVKMVESIFRDGEEVAKSPTVEQRRAVGLEVIRQINVCGLVGKPANSCVNAIKENLPKLPTQLLVEFIAAVLEVLLVLVFQTPDHHKMHSLCPGTA